VIGDELAIEQLESAYLQSRDQISQRHFGGVARAAEHAFAEEGAGQLDAVEPPDEGITLPAFDRMGMAAFVKRSIGAFDFGIDPGVGPIRRGLGAAMHDVTKCPVSGYAKASGADRLRQRAREMEAVEREDAALLRLNPEDVLRPPAVGHRENTDGIGAQEEIGIESRHSTMLNDFKFAHDPALLKILSVDRHCQIAGCHDCA